jgi:hypothetical protein
MKDSPVPGRPMVDRTPAGPTLSLAPRTPTDKPSPDFETLRRRPGISRTERWDRSQDSVASPT